MNVSEFISGIFKPLTEMVNSVHTSKEEKILAQAKLTEVQNIVSSKLIELQAKLAEIQGSVIQAEASGSWLQKNWRPMTMIIFVSLVVASFLGFTPEGTSETMILKLLDIVEIGLGGYVIGRSAEKVAVTIKDIIKK